MDDLHSLYQSILAAPDEDTPRRMFADCLDERRESPESAAVAEFIRLQLQMHADYPPRWQFYGTVRPRGPQYFEIDGDFGCLPYVKPGDRVDVNRERKLNESGSRRLHGALVVKVIPDDDGDVRFSLKIDEYSKPFPIKEAQALTDQLNDLWQKDNIHRILSDGLHKTLGEAMVSNTSAADWPTFGPGYWLHPVRHGLDFRLSVERGFVSRFAGPMRDWYQFAAHLTRHYPITEVVFTDCPSLFSGDPADDQEVVMTNVRNYPTVRTWRLPGG